MRNYVEETVPSYSDNTFLSHFRLKRVLADDLIRQFSESDIFTSLYGHGGNNCISPEKHVLAFLWFVGHEAGSYRDIADRFDLTLSTLHSVVKRVTTFLFSLTPQVIRLPTAEEKRLSKAHFMDLKHFPGVLGAIDGSHIRLDKPTEDKDAYVNRKHYFSIILQGVVDYRRKFMDVFVGFPGSVHDARVFRNSSIKDLLPTLCQDGGYILGDSAYPCLPHLIVPYRDNGHLTRAQVLFNARLSSCRVVVEHAFGMLKQRFRQLYYLKSRSMEEVVKIIQACCVLHNLADEDDLQHFLEDAPADDMEENAAGVMPPIGVEAAEEHLDARMIRDEVCRQLAMQ